MEDQDNNNSAIEIQDYDEEDEERMSASLTVDDIGDDSHNDENNNDNNENRRHLQSAQGAINDDNNENEQDKNYKIVHFLTQSNAEDTIIRIKMTSKISKIIKHFTRQYQTPVRLIYEGRQLQPNQRFQDIDYTDDDIIDVMTEQTGGGGFLW